MVNVSKSLDEASSGSFLFGFIFLIFLLMLRYIPLLVAIVVIGFTSWASIPSFGYPLGGYSQADISNMYPTAITPAGFTFSIWSLIYLSWLIAGVYIARLPMASLTQKIF